jgi:uncharacterized membrane protein
MKKWILWTSLGTLALAIIMHIVTVTTLPMVIMSVGMSRFPANQLIKAPRVTAQSRTVVRPSPDLIYSAVCYDVSKEPVRLIARVPADTYWSTSGYAANTDNFFVVNDRQVKSNPAEILLVRQGMQAPNPGNAQVVISPTDKGIILIRYLISSDNKFQELASIQNDAHLEVGK